MRSLILSVILNVNVKLFGEFCSEEKVRCIEELVGDRPNTEVIVSLNAIVVDTKAIVNSKENIFVI